MALSDDLRKRVVETVVEGGVSRNAAAKRFEVSIASAVHWVKRYETTGEISPAPSSGDRRSRRRIEAHRDYLLGLIRRTPDMTLLEIKERLVANCGECFFGFRAVALLRPSRGHSQKRLHTPRSSSARTS
jgi:transposase